MTIPASAQIPGLLQASQNPAIVDPKTGNLTTYGFSIFDQMYHFMLGTCRIIPCNPSTASNVITLTLLPTSPRVIQYADYDRFSFVADVTSTGNVTAKIVTLDGSLSTLNVYKTMSTQAAAGDIVSGSFYDFVYIDALNSGAGGFLVK